VLDRNPNQGWTEKDPNFKKLSKIIQIHGICEDDSLVSRFGLHFPPVSLTLWLMLAKVYSCAVLGLDGVVVDVEVDTSNGLPSFALVGLPDTAVQESRERVQAAIRNSGFHFPQKRITVNLAPAALRKEGPAYDLPIAVGILVASGQITQEALEGALIFGELSLDGRVRHVRGVLPGLGAGQGL
jgi:hypothetical protein